MPQRGGEAVGGKGRAFRLCSHEPVPLAPGAAGFVNSPAIQRDACESPDLSSGDAAKAPLAR
jgi:hypothetical protein